MPIINKNDENYFTSNESCTLTQPDQNPNIYDLLFPPQSPILQVDGNNSLPTPCHSLTRVLPPISTVTHPIPGSSSAGAVKQASFAMNKKKQLKKLGNDTQRPDFAIKVSPNNENVNIECSTGFYTQVAIPGLKGLRPGHSETVSGIIVSCWDIVGNIDAGGADLNTVLHFRLHQDKLCVGGVVVHLHNSTRLIQVQGSAVLPDNSHAPVWFVDNFIKSRLSQLSSTKAQEVASFNRAVQETVSRYLKTVGNQATCAGCNLSFNGRSVPESCQACSKQYHKFKCFPTSVHPCYAKARTKSCSTTPVAPQPLYPTPIRSSNSLEPPTPHQVLPGPSPVLHALTPGERQLLPPAPAHHIDHQASRTPPAHDEQQSIPTPLHITDVTPAQNTLSAGTPLNADAPPFISSQEVPCPASQPIPRVTGTRKKTKQVPATDPKGLELEFAKYSLNTAKTKICEQETEINDLKFRNKILEDRIASLEKRQKQQINDEISRPPLADSYVTTCCRPRHCCNQAPATHCCSSATHHPVSNVSNAKLDKASADIENHAELLTELMKKVDCISHSLSTTASVSQENQTIVAEPSSSPKPQQVPPPPALSPADNDPPAGDISTLSIDYAMSDVSLSEVSLNSSHPTTQLP